MEDRDLHNEHGGNAPETTHSLPAERSNGDTAPAREIVTRYIYPPIPDRRFDWCAVTDDYDGAEDSHCPIGYGPTEEAAIADLMMEIEARS